MGGGGEITLLLLISLTWDPRVPPAEIPLLRSPKGEIFGGSTIPVDNPDRVVFRRDGSALIFHGGDVSCGQRARGLRQTRVCCIGFLLLGIFFSSKLE